MLRLLPNLTTSAFQMNLSRLSKNLPACMRSKMSFAHVGLRRLRTQRNFQVRLWRKLYKGGLEETDGKTHGLINSRGQYFNLI